MKIAPDKMYTNFKEHLLLTDSRAAANRGLAKVAGFNCLEHLPIKSVMVFMFKNV
jgi:hypothetical protein